MALLGVALFALGLSSLVKGLPHHRDCPSTGSLLATSVNVKTVLFKEVDFMRPCFDVDTVHILAARRAMQDLVPKKIARDYADLLDYISKVEVTLKAKSLEEHDYKLLKTAAYDALGGYLHAFVIPVMNEAFYAGKVELKTALEVHNVLRRMMSHLKTTGGKWANPCDMDKMPTKVQPLPLNLCQGDQSCDNFVIASDLQANVEEAVGIMRSNKTSCVPEKPRIQLPFLDDDTYPNAIVVPFKEHALFSLVTACSVNIVPKYYILAMRCLSHPQFTNEDIICFNQRLHRWIMTIVLPHLQDTDRFFPGFGGIMRVVETMKQRGLASSFQLRSNLKPVNHSYAIPLDIDETWYEPYVKKLATLHHPIIVFLVPFLLIAFVLYRIKRCCTINDECTCDECVCAGGGDSSTKSTTGKS